ncbi:MAG: aliphatic sulfonate ABC transporter substrate-binding protein, partial [Verrucomicrobiota bacterium]|nr:aliphatic sulfonate ABC transporter substrate-binding protein [Verrucomicrobiota bacterium]
NANAGKARSLVRAALQAEVKRDISPVLVAKAWSRLRFTDKVTQSQFDSLMADAQSVGFLRNSIPLDRLFSRKP